MKPTKTTNLNPPAAKRAAVVSLENSSRATGSRKLSGNRGAALLAAMCFTLVLALALGSYITACYRALQMSTRNMSSGHSVELAETGMEEALWALHDGTWSGWATSGTTATKTISGFTYDGGATGSIAITITNYNSATATRSITVTGTTTLSDGTTSSRTLTSTSAQAALFVNAIAGTTGKVKFKNAGTVDSYDSSINVDPNTGQTPGFSAIVSSGSTSATATVQLTNAQIKGYVATLSTGPSYSTSGKLVGPSTSASVKIDTSRQTTSPYQPIFDEIVPTAPTPLPTGTASIGTAGGSTTYYYAGDIDLTAAQTLTVNGPVVLVVSGHLYVNGSIVIASTGSLEIHLAGDLAIDGSGITNNTKLPKKLSIISTSNGWDSYEMGTNTPFYGVIYTPYNSLTVSNSQTIYGSIVAKSVTFTLSPTFHYDLNLRKVSFAGLDTPYAVANVRETANP
jgi:hypothetical protein